MVFRLGFEGARAAPEAAVETFGEAVARRIAKVVLPAAERERLARLTLPDAGHGYDVFGLHPAWVELSAGIGRFLYDHYFRVESIGAENIPARGPAILAANHAGMLPLDAVMLHLDILGQTEPPRLGRPVADWFVPLLPLVSTVFARSGVVSGSRRNIARLLESGELIELFPEGVSGIGKPFSERYHLQGWTVGHAELAIRHQVPVVPVAIIGSEEQWIELLRIRRFHWFGAPYLPVPLFLLPLPVRYHIYYGEPLVLHQGRKAADADDPAILEAAAARVRQAVEALIARGLRARQGIFR
jgi:1-acyl-sn-glycerol-3-phosphate acyltransferase